MTERRFREFRRLYQTYPQLAQPILEYISDNVEIRRLPTAEFQSADNEQLIMPGDRLFNRLSSTHLTMISVIDDPLKRLFYEIETINGCWSVAELDRQISSLYYERSGLSKNKEALSALVNSQALQLMPQESVIRTDYARDGDPDWEENCPFQSRWPLRVVLARVSITRT